MSTDNRIVYGYLDRPIPALEGEVIRKGIINVLFEKIDGEIYPINQEELYDESKKIFLQDSFTDLAFRSYKQLIEITSIENRNYGDRPNLTRYVTFGNQTTNISTDTCFSFVFTRLPDSLAKTSTLPTAPLSKLFFVVDQDIAYGPFKIEYSTEEKNDATKEYPAHSFVTGIISQATTKESGLSRTSPSNIAKFNYKDFKEKHAHKIYSAVGLDFLFDTKLLLQHDYDTHPFITASEVVTYLQSIAARRVLPKENISSITKDLKTSKLPYTEESKRIIEHVCAEATKKDEWLTALIGIISSDEVGRDIIKRYFEGEKDKYVNDWNKIAGKRHVDMQSKIDELSSEILSLESQLNNKRAEVINIDREIKRKEETLASEIDDTAIKRDIEEKRLKLDKEIQLKKEELDALRLDFERIKAEHKLAQDVVSLEHEHNSLVIRIARQQESLRDIQTQLNKSETELQIELRKQIPFVSSIIQAPIERAVELKKISDAVVINKDVSDSESATKLTETIIGNITHCFNKENGRNYSPSFIASILVANFQSL